MTDSGLPRSSAAVADRCPECGVIIPLHDPDCATGRARGAANSAKRLREAIATMAFRPPPRPGRRADAYYPDVVVYDGDALGAAQRAAIADAIDQRVVIDPVALAGDLVELRRTVDDVVTILAGTHCASWARKLKSALDTIEQHTGHATPTGAGGAGTGQAEGPCDGDQRQAGGAGCASTTQGFPCGDGANPRPEGTPEAAVQSVHDFDTDYPLSKAAAVAGERLASLEFRDRKGHGGAPVAFRHVSERELAAMLGCAYQLGAGGATPHPQPGNAGISPGSRDTKPG